MTSGFKAVAVLLAALSPGFAGEEGQAFTNSLGMKFVRIPDTPLWVSVWETRVRDYAAYAEATPGVPSFWRTPKYRGLMVTPGGDCPVVNVSLDEARVFCEWLSRKEGMAYRIPTDAEWATIAGPELTGALPRRWPPEARSANFADAAALGAIPGLQGVEGYEDGFATAAPVGSFAPSRHGIYDLAGNVSEWTETVFDRRFPLEVVVRGASWADFLEPDIRYPARCSGRSYDHFPTVGFRLVTAGPLGAPAPVKGRD